MMFFWQNIGLFLFDSFQAICPIWQLLPGCRMRLPCFGRKDQIFPNIFAINQSQVTCKLETTMREENLGVGGSDVNDEDDEENNENVIEDDNFIYKRRSYN